MTKKMIRRMCSRLRRPEIITLLDKIDVVSHDDSSDDDLRELLVGIVEDGQITERELNAAQKKSALKEYYALPVTESPEEFLKGYGNWGLTETEYKKAKTLAQLIIKLDCGAY